MSKYNYEKMFHEAAQDFANALIKIEQLESQVKRYREALERICEDALVFDNKYIRIASEALKEGETE